MVLGGGSVFTGEDRNEANIQYSILWEKGWVAVKESELQSTLPVSKCASSRSSSVILGLNSSVSLK